MFKNGLNKAQLYIRYILIALLSAVTITFSALGFTTMFKKDGSGLASADNSTSTVADGTWSHTDSKYYGATYSGMPAVARTYEIGGKAEDVATQWQNAVNNAKNTDWTKIKLTSDWKATSSAGFSTTGTAFINGMINVPAGKQIILDLNNYSIDRSLSVATANGGVIRVYGKLIITDLSTAKGGSITGGHSNTLEGDYTKNEGIAGGLTIEPNAECTLAVGNVTGNRVSGNTGTGASGYEHTGVGVLVKYQSVFNMYEGGQITYNYGMAGSVDGAGLEVHGTFNMYGGEVSNNRIFMGSVGGAIDATNGTVNMSGGRIINNMTTSRGGAIELFHRPNATFYGGNTPTFNMSGGQISGNICENGVAGGVNAWGADDGKGNATVKITGGTICDNTAKTYAGGIHVRNVEQIIDAVSISGANTYINNNKAGTYGDNVCYVGTATKMSTYWAKAIENCPNSNVQISFTMSSSWTATAIGEGGNSAFVTSFGGATDTSTDLTKPFYYGMLNIPANKNVVLDLWGGTLNRGLTTATPYGGVIFNSGKLEIIDRNGGNGKITGGYSSTTGSDITTDGIAGGITVAGSAELTIRGGSVCANRASGPGSGGGINLRGSSKFNMYGGSVANNITKGGSADGGGIASINSIIKIYGGEITGNMALGLGSSCGGGINIFYGETYIYGGTISGNKAQGGGGGIAIWSNQAGKGTLEMEGGVITGNVSNENGGGIGGDWNQKHTVTLKGGSITNNVAKNYGGTSVMGDAGITTLNLSGNVQIVGNYKATVTTNLDNETITYNESTKVRSNLTIVDGTDGNTINASGFTGSVGITHTATTIPVTFTSGLNSTTAQNLFFSDVTGRKVSSTSGKEAQLVAESDATKVYVPQPKGLTPDYIGKSQTVISGYNPTYMTASATPSGATLANNIYSATNPGTYEVTFTLISGKGYVWSNGSTSAVTVKGIVKKVVLDLKIASPVFYYDGTEKQPMITEVSSVTPVSVNLPALNTFTIKGATNAGQQTAIVTISTANQAYYCFKCSEIWGSGISYTYDYTKEVTFTILQSVLKLNWGNTELTYNGAELRPTITSLTATGVSNLPALDKMVAVTGGSTNAGSGTAVATLKDTSGNFSFSAGGLVTTTSTGFTINPLDIGSTGAGVTATIADQEYSRTAKTPAPTVKFKTSAMSAERALTANPSDAKGKDAYTYNTTTDWANNTNAKKSTDTGAPQLTIHGAGNFTGTRVIKFNINKKPLTLTAGTLSKDYNGVSQTVTDSSFTGICAGDTVEKPTVTLSAKSGGTALVGTSAINAGTYTATYSLPSGLSSNYSFTSTTKDFTINPMAITYSGWGAVGTYTYNGNAQGPAWNKTMAGVNGETITFALKEALPTNAGTGYTRTVQIASVAGGQAKTANYSLNASGATSGTFAINRLDISDGTVSGISDVTYNGQARTHTITVTKNGLTATFTPTYTNNTNKGTASVKIEGTDNFTGTINKTFEISALNIGTGSSATGISDQVYKGSAWTFTPVLSNTGLKTNGGVLASGTEYSVSYADNTNAGNASVTFEGKGNFTGTYTVPFKIAKAVISGVTWDNTADYNYNGATKQPKISNLTTENNATLPTTAGEMFEYTGGTALAGSHTATATLKADYRNNFELGSGTGSTDKVSTTRAFKIVTAGITIAGIVELVEGAYALTYDGKKHGIFVNNSAPTVTLHTNATQSDKDSVKWYYKTSTDTDWQACPNGWADIPTYTNAGTYEIQYKVTADNHTDNIGTITIKINPLNLESASTLGTITVSNPDNPTYDNEEHKPTVTVKFNGTTLQNETSAGAKDRDYYYVYGTDVTSAGTKTMYIRGTGNFTGEVQKQYTIDRRTIDTISVSVSGYGNVIYNGASQTPDNTLTVTDGLSSLTNPVLALGTDYTVSYSSDTTNVGTVTITITGIGNYKGTKTVTYDITSATMTSTNTAISGYTSSVVYKSAEWTFDGLTVKVTLDGKEYTLTAGTDYSVGYANNKSAGTATISVTGLGGNYTGTVTANFTIEKKQLSVTWDESAVKDGKHTYTYAGQTSGGFAPTAKISGGFDADNLALTYAYKKGSSNLVGKPVNAGDYTVTASLASNELNANYYFTTDGDANDKEFTENIKINPAKITGIDGITADSREYDKTTDVTIHYDNVTFQGVIGDDKLTVASATGAFGGVTAGMQTVTISSIVLGGEMADNYELALGTTPDSFDLADKVEIQKREVEVALEWTSKPYSPTQDRPEVLITNRIEGDKVEALSRLKSGNKPFVPQEYIIEVYSLTNDGGNYVLSSTQELKFRITTDKTQVKIDDKTLSFTFDGKAHAPEVLKQIIAEDNTETWEKVEEGANGYTIVITAKDGSATTVVDGKACAINAGEYTATITIDEYLYQWGLETTLVKSFDFTIEKATFDGFTFNDKTEDYDGNVHKIEIALTGGLTSLPEGITVAYLYDGVAGTGKTDAKESGYTVTARFTVNGNYNPIDDVTAVLIINKLTYNISSSVFGNDSTTYDGGVKKIPAIASGLPAGVSVSGYEYFQGATSFGTEGVREVGVYTVRAYLDYDATNYKLTLDNAPYANDYITAQFEILKQSATVTIDFNDKEVTYDGQVHQLLISGTSQGIKSVSYSYVDKNGVNYGADGVVNAGTYTVTVSFEIDDANFSGSIQNQTATLTINKAPLTIRANDYTVTYGDINPYTGTASDVLLGMTTFTGLVAGDSKEDVGRVTLNCGYLQYNSVGEYAVVPNITGANHGAKYDNYSITFAGATNVDEAGVLTVKPLTVEVKWFNDNTAGSAQDLTYIYAEDAGGNPIAHKPHAVVSNAVNNDKVTLTVSGEQYKVGIRYEAKVDSVDNPNYALPANGITVQFNILPEPKNGKIIWDNTTLYYNGKAQAPKAYYYATENDNTPTELAVTTNKDAIGAGTYIATASLGENYTLTGEKTKTFTIEKREVYIVIGNLTVNYGETPDFTKVTWSYLDGSLPFADGENYTLTFSAGGAKDVGAHPISVEFNCVNASNYILHTAGDYKDGESGILTINEIPLDLDKITFVGTTVTYERGVKHTLTVNGLPSTVTPSFEYTQNGWSLGANGVENVGTYRVVVSFTTTDPNYPPIPDKIVEMKVEKAGLTVTANSVNIIYGDAPANGGVVYSIDGVEAYLGGTLKYEILYNRYDPAGSYRITPYGLVSDNYEITFVPGQLNVAPKELNVVWYDDQTATSQTFKYTADGNPHLPYAVVTGGLVNNQTVVLDITGEATVAGENYTAKIARILNSDGTVNNNYVVKTNSSVTFNIIPEDYVLVWDNSPLYYTGSNVKPKAYYYIDGERIELTEALVVVTGDHKLAGGTYTAKVDTVVEKDGVQHALKGEITYTILRQEVTVTLDSLSGQTYGQTLAEILDKLTSNANAEVAGDLVISIKGQSDLNAKLNAGTYEIVATYSGANYSVTIENGTLTIDKADVDESGLAFKGDATVDYDGRVHNLVLAVNGDETKLPEGVTGVTYVYKDASGKVVDANNVIAVGRYTVTATFTVDGNHKAIETAYTATVTINQTALDGEISFTNDTVIYDGNAHRLLVSGDMTGIAKVEYFVDGDPFTGATEVGTYTVTAKFTTVDGNYSVADKTATLTIDKAKLTISANSFSVVYGEDPVDSTEKGYSFTGLAGADYENLATILGSISYVFEDYNGNAGTYKIVIAGGNASTANYDISYEKGTLTVTPFVLTADNVVWTGSNFGYTGSKQAPTATVKDVKDNIVLVVDGGKTEVGSNYTAKVVAIENADGSVNKNYALPVDGLTCKFSILPVAPDKAGKVVWDNSPIYYDGEAHAPEAWYYESEDSTVGTPLTVEAEEAIDVNSDGYTAKVTVNGKEFTTKFYITARPVYVVIGDMSVEYGQTPNMDAVSVTYRDGSLKFIDGDNCKVTLTHEQITAIKTYPISGSFYSDKPENYEVFFTGSWASADGENGRHGTLTVTKAEYDMSKISFIGAEVVYDGQFHTLQVAGLPAGVTVENITYTLGDFGYGITGVKNAGKYTAVISFKGDEFHEAIANVTTTITIKKAGLTIKANDNTIYYGDEPSEKGVSYSVEGVEHELKGGIAYTYDYRLKDNVGEYTITPSGLTSDNYEIKFLPGTLTVAPRTITVTWYDDATLGAQTFRYDCDDVTYYLPYPVAGGLVQGDTLVLVPDGEQRFAGENYKATISGIFNADGSVNKNYALPADGTEYVYFSVIPGEYSIIWDNSPIYYVSGKAQAPSAYYYDAKGERVDLDVIMDDDSAIPTDAGTYLARAVRKSTDTNTNKLSGDTLHKYEILKQEVTVHISSLTGENALVFDPARTLEQVLALINTDANAEVKAGITIIVGGITDITTVLNAREYVISGSYSGKNYSVTFVDGALTVKKADINVSGVNYALDGDASLTVVYDGKLHTLTAGNLPDGVKGVTYAYFDKDGNALGANGVKESGAYTVKVTFVLEDPDNYNELTVVEKTITVGKKTASLAGATFAGATEVEYDGAKHSLYVTGGTAVGILGVTYTYTNTETHEQFTDIDGVVNAGTYSVSASFTVDTANYEGTVSIPDATLEIKKAKIKVTANNATAVYGDTANTNGYTVTGLKGNDTEADILGSVTLNIITHSDDAGVYAKVIQITLGKSTATNYDIDTAEGTLTILPRTISITWYKDSTEAEEGTNFTYGYDATNAGATYIPHAKAGNLVGGDSLTLDVQTAKSDAGDNYVATVQPIANPNYILPSGGITCNFTIEYKQGEEPEKKVVWDYNTPYYDGLEHKPTAKYFDKAVNEWIIIPDGNIEISSNGKPVSAKNAGVYKAEIKGMSIAFSSDSELSVTFEILKRPVVIEIDDVEATYGTNYLANLRYSYENLALTAEDEALLTFAYGSDNSVGKYPIEAVFGGNADNYELTFKGGWYSAGDAQHNGTCGTLTVNKASYDMSKFQISNLSYTYDGSHFFASVTGSPVDFDVKYTLGGWSYDMDTGVVNAGRYVVTVSFDCDPNYEAIADRTAILTVNKAKLTVTANDSTVVYGEEPADKGASYAGFVTGENKDVLGGALVYTYNYSKGGNAGTYRITPAGLTATNYEITYVSGTLTVEKRVVTVTWYSNEKMNNSSLSYVYDGSTQFKPYAHAGNVLAGDTVELTVDGGKVNAGLGYVAKITAISNPNYALPATGTEASFDVIPNEFTIVWESKTFVYNGEKQAPTAFYYCADGMIPLPVTVKGVTGGNPVYAGTYTAVATYRTGSDVITDEHEFTIERRPVTVVVEDGKSFYNQPIVTGTPGWHCADGTSFIGGASPVIVTNTAKFGNPAGKYQITARCTDTVNYDVTFVFGTYTIEKAIVEAPVVAPKTYTGSTITSGLENTDKYTVYLDKGGERVGSYPVVLELVDYENYAWDNTVRSVYTVMYDIVKAENSWTQEYTVRNSVVAGSGGKIDATPAISMFGNSNIIIEFFDNKDCLGSPIAGGEEYITTKALAGTYYVRVTVPGTVNYSELSSVYEFEVTGKLMLYLHWENTSLVYNGTEQAPKAFVWLNGREVELVVTTNATSVNADTYTATASLTAKDGTDLSSYDFSEGAGSASREITFVIAPASITISIDEDLESGYGTPTKPLDRLLWSVITGNLFGTDNLASLGVTFDCEFGNENAGKYPIIGHCANTNYAVEFTGSWATGDLAGKAGTYTIKGAIITVNQSGTTWFDEEGAISANQSYFVTLGAVDDNGEYVHISLVGGQKANITYSIQLDQYDADIHDELIANPEGIKGFFANGVSVNPPEIKEVGNWVVYFRIEAPNHEVKYGIWRVVIQPKDQFVIIKFNPDKPYAVPYGESIEGKDLIHELINGGYITVDGAIKDLNELRSVAHAYAYEDVSGQGMVNGSTGAKSYTIMFNFDPIFATRPTYKNLVFKYSDTNVPGSDTNLDKYVITPRKLSVEWGDMLHVYDGAIHLPTIKLSGFVDEEEIIDLEGFVLGTPRKYQLGNGDVVYITVELTTSNSTLMDIGAYGLKITVDNANYAFDGTETASLVINPAPVEPPKGDDAKGGLALPWWAIVIIAVGGSALLILVIVLIVKRKKPVAGDAGDDDGFYDDVES